MNKTLFSDGDFIFAVGEYIFVVGNYMFAQGEQRKCTWKNKFTSFEQEVYQISSTRLTHIAQLISSNSLKFNHLIFREALSGALQILT